MSTDRWRVNNKYPSEKNELYQLLASLTCLLPGWACNDQLSACTAAGSAQSRCWSTLKSYWGGTHTPTDTHAFTHTHTHTRTTPFTHIHTYLQTPLKSHLYDSRGLTLVLPLPPPSFTHTHILHTSSLLLMRFLTHAHTPHRHSPFKHRGGTTFKRSDFCRHKLYQLYPYSGRMCKIQEFFVLFPPEQSPKLEKKF